MPQYPKEITYSKKFSDDLYYYRYVVLPKEIYSKIYKMQKLLSEPEWRSLGLQGSQGWEHFEFYRQEPHVLLFRKKKEEEFV